MRQMPQKYERLAYPAVTKLPGAERTIQVNHCKMPACENCGLPTRWEPTYGLSGERDMAYTLRHSSGVPGGMRGHASQSIASSFARTTRQALWSTACAKCGLVPFGP